MRFPLWDVSPTSVLAFKIVLSSSFPHYLPICGIGIAFQSVLPPQPTGTAIPSVGDLGLFDFILFTLHKCYSFLTDGYDLLKTWNILSHSRTHSKVPSVLPAGAQ